MPQIPESFFTNYERLLLRNIGIFSNRIRALYHNAIVEVSLTAAQVRTPNFNLDDYPQIRAKIQNVLRQMQAEMTATINQATSEAWDLANGKNDRMLRTILGKRTLPKGVTDRIFNPNVRALSAFQNRREAGMRLSSRIWKLIAPFKHELEAGLTHGINKGQSAASMATDLKRYLKDPDKLFRRVRDEQGRLQLSRAARAYHPGRGKYRSSYKNAARLTRTETNMSYRNADYERWNANEFVLGFEIKLSLSHPKYDICDPMAGQYPKTFKWAGWHPHCLCYAIPVLMKTENFEDAMRDILGTRPAGAKKVDPTKQYVKDVPAGFKKYVKANAERILGWQTLPYWVRDNPSFVQL